MDWDDLRIIAAISGSGTFARAGVRLRLDETTVARRLARLQKALGVTLFEAVDGVRKPTAQCEAILGHVHEMARHVAEIGSVGAKAHGVVGRFRIATTNSLAQYILAPRAGPFLAHNPGLTLQFMTSGQNVNFSRWEADLAIRLRKPDKGDFTITKLGEIRLFLFEPAEPPADRETVICCYPDELEATPESRFLAKEGLQARSRCVTDNVGIIRGLISSHAAIGILPEYACDGLLADQSLRARPLPQRREVWLLVQNHLKQVPASRVVIDWLRESFTGLVEM
ncbi:transcriptional regulator, LysR family [Rhizobiales bacterium GAS191]|jgi:DNA-binding transcriptional LysR family regulator|nr:transcriptional regulator, LysR family [Rhizobiales bacterium GAS191]